MTRTLENARWMSLKSPGRLADARLEWARNRAEEEREARNAALEAEIAAEQRRQRPAAA